jgi:hypothetical protein
VMTLVGDRRDTGDQQCKAAGENGKTLHLGILR